VRCPDKGLYTRIRAVVGARVVSSRGLKWLTVQAPFARHVSDLNDHGEITRCEGPQRWRYLFRDIFSGDIQSVEGLRYISISEHKHVSEGEAPARRIEIFAGAGRRRA
jgi:hypothetical protein